MSYRAPWKNRMNIFVQKIGGTEPVQVTQDTIRDVGGYFWKGDRLVYSRDINGDENFIVFSASIDGADVKALTPLKDVRAGVMDDLHNIPGMEQSVMIQMNQRNPQVFDPYLCNIVTGELKSLYDNKENFEGWTTDHTGLIRIASRTDGTDQVLYHRASANEPFVEFMRTGFKDSFGPQFFTFDNRNIYASTNLNGRDKVAIVEFDLATGKEIRDDRREPRFRHGQLGLQPQAEGAHDDDLDRDRRANGNSWTKRRRPCMKSWRRTSRAMNSGSMGRTTTRPNSWSGPAAIANPASTTSMMPLRTS